MLDVIREREGKQRTNLINKKQHRIFLVDASDNCSSEG